MRAQAPTASCTVARCAAALVVEARRMAPADVHADCNRYLAALRQGSRRRTYSALRRLLRLTRARAAAQMTAGSAGAGGS